MNKILSRSLVVGSLTTISLLCGVIPGLSQNFRTLEFSSSVYAQSDAVSEAEVKSYAQAVLAMEPLRQSAYNEIKKIVGGEIPEMECDRPASVRTLPPQAQAIVRNYCNQSLALVANYLPAPRFNEITTLARRNNQLKERIREELRRLQQ